MTCRLSSRFSRRLAVLAASVAVLCSALALSSSSASASPFCGGQVLSNFAYCHGAPRDMSGDSGYGNEHSICIGANAISGGCSTGPGAIKTMSLGNVIHGEPWIEDNAAGSTVVHGETF
jgi:hypothetical protein